MSLWRSKSSRDAKCYSLSEYWKSTITTGTRMHHSLGSCNVKNRRCLCFYCVKINPKDIRRTYGQKLVALAPSGLTSLTSATPPIWILAENPPSPPSPSSPCVWQSSWCILELTRLLSMRFHFVYDMNPIVNLHAKVVQTHTHTHTYTNTETLTLL